MLEKAKIVPPEILISAFMIMAMLILSALFRLPVVMPTSTEAPALQIHYTYPLAGVGLIGIYMWFLGNRAVAMRFFTAAPCYALVLFAHFNIKLWIPHINPLDFDGVYWRIDQALRPVVDLAFAIRRGLLPMVTYESNLYLNGYIAMFYVSFLYHAIRTPDLFGKLVVAVLIHQSIGTFAYLVAPAVGPFIYEPGTNPYITLGQDRMLDFYHSSMALGPDWLRTHGGPNFAAGLAAMPSLHAASSFLFYLFARKHATVLLPLFSMLLGFILVTAVASRWHYLIDIPVGMAIAWASYVLSDKITAWSESPNESPDVSGQPIPLPA